MSQSDHMSVATALALTINDACCSSGKRGSDLDYQDPW